LINVIRSAKDILPQGVEEEEFEVEERMRPAPRASKIQHIDISGFDEGPELAEATSEHHPLWN
jgi:hypothetical protein